MRRQSLEAVQKKLFGTHQLIREWFVANRLVLNVEKTQQVIFSLCDLGNANNRVENVKFQG